VAKRIAVLVNPTSGKGRGARAATTAISRLRELGCSVTELVGADGPDAVLLARHAVLDGYETLVAVGGDGMVHLVLQAVAGTAVELGIVAAGSGNDFAKTLGLPLHDPRAAADIIAAGRTRVADAGRVTVPGEASPVWFACVLSSGFDSLVNERGNRMRWPRGPMRYNVATMAELRVFSPVPFSFAVDGVRTQQTAMFVAVGNASSYGGGMRICPSALIDDG
jgi:diacylglycerol kinase (ATP)